MSNNKKQPTADKSAENSKSGVKSAATKTATPATKTTAAAKTATPATKTTSATKTATPATKTTAAAKTATPATKTTAAAKTATPATKTTAATKTEQGKTSVALKKPVSRNAAPVDTEPTVTVKTDLEAKKEARSKMTLSSLRAAALAHIGKSDKNAARTAVSADSNVVDASAKDKHSSAKNSKTSRSDKAVKVSASNSSKSGKSATAVADDKKRKRNIIIIAAAAAAVVLLVLIIVLVCCLGGKTDPATVITPYDPTLDNKGTTELDPIDPNDGLPSTVFVNAYANKTKVGYYAEYLGEVSRSVPSETQDGGLVVSGTIPKYPTYGYTVALDTAAKNAVILESWKLCATTTRIGTDGFPQNTYDAMDAQGNLYLNGEATGERLYKHTAAVGMYMGDVADDEPAISKRFTFMPRGYSSYNVTGMYAPAGEVIKVEISEADMVAAGNRVIVYIGQALYNSKANNIWSARNVNRMPVILNTMYVQPSNCTFDEQTRTYTGYVGSFLGGPIYIANSSNTFSVTISGGVRYSHYILGYTSEEEFKENAASSAPYFDLEVRDYGVLLSGPNYYAKAFSYDEIYQAALMWEKISLVSTQITRQGIVFLFDPFVAAGAAVAFPGQYSVNCPASWLASVLNYKSFVNSGSWGAMHEYNHNFQGWGLPGGGEVTNNSVNLVEYSLFTRISSNRKLGSSGDGLSAWNRYTVASWAAQQVCGSRENDLSIYATLLHAFGQDNFIKVAATKRNGVDNYFTQFAETTHNDMTYYASLVGKSMSDTAISAMKAKNYSMFVPVASIYQTGRSYLYDGVKKYVKTMQPYAISYGDEFTLDLRPYTLDGNMYSYGSIILPSGFTFTVKSISEPANGKLTDNGNGVFTYTPDADQMSSGSIIVTLGITKNDGAFKVDDVDLVIELVQSHEMNKTMLERVTYTYAEGTAPSSAREAFESGFNGCTSAVEADNVNPVQNGNTEIWSAELLPDDTFYEVRGKFYIDETAKYRLALRGRWDCAVFTAVNKDEGYTLAAQVQTTATHANFYTDESTYMDFEDLQAGDWLYFRAVLKSTHKGGTNAYIGLGWGKFTPPLGVIEGEGDNSVSGATEETVTIQYATAYRRSYEFTDDTFETAYFYTRQYVYNYYTSDIIDVDQTCVSSEYVPWDSSDTYNIQNMFDGNTDTYIHSGRYNVTSKPFVAEVRLSKTVTANRITFYSTTGNHNAVTYLPKTFKVWVGTDAENLVLACEVSSSVMSNYMVSGDFDSTYTFSYYKIEVSDTHSSAAYKYIAIGKVDFSYIVSYPGGTLVENDNSLIRYRGDWTTENAICSFGHIYVGQEGSAIEFKFDGNRFAMFAVKSAEYGSVEIIIDGDSVGTISLTGNGSVATLAYLSGKLLSGTHTVVIKSVSGKLNLDSFAVWGS